jgi:hypothetical protein
LASALSSGSNFGWSLFFWPCIFILHGSTACPAIVPVATLVDSASDGGLVVPASSKVSGVPLASGPAHPLGRGLFFAYWMPAQNPWMRRMASSSSALLAA